MLNGSTCITNEFTCGTAPCTHAFQIPGCLCRYRNAVLGKSNTSLPQTYPHLQNAPPLLNKRSVQAVAEAADLRRGPLHVELRMQSDHRSSRYWQGALVW